MQKLENNKKMQETLFIKDYITLFFDLFLIKFFSSISKNICKKI